ncbi:MAG: hypothetical protein B6D72_05995 [gamma proteobacterium symbiont of Ctena orbiculata]|uniref:Uncharacterized protein n=1 Tax=Candidatus Thiodiazotropha taylori TaxID=2792791 RepID=A0A944MAN6_9GAMM|nr:hypothetical protein [Candidatus Thiodiazotropha taylori]PUB86588.1 MAG: hypothetical protein DBP00_10755 [gamma proteobacterium symbiont of Ctena orbiculata]MBT2987912.1 hypothetical protein [Candidatus Thiodiazotropha taylori]MBT2997557.1 hypothetical protein [Candidatus Thiodiazotropha taylori]MBT2999017.1 hypothetical protein [Candidatus Thiodiazotropha taylori]
MVSPVTSDKPINTTTEQSGRSHASQTTTETAAAQAKQQPASAPANGPTVEVDQARRLFDIENNRIESSETLLNTPEEARSMMLSIVQQMAASPETAAKAQAAKASSPLSDILQNAPA